MIKFRWRFNGTQEHLGVCLNFRPWLSIPIGPDGSGPYHDIQIARRLDAINFVRGYVFLGETGMKTYEALIAMSLISGSANATDFSFAGNFEHRNEVQEFNFAVAGTPKEVVMRTWSFAGGINAEGAVVEHGGFDPMVTLFDASGVRIGFSDDGGTLSARDPVSGHTWDPFLVSLLSPGSYTATVTQFSNFPRGLLTDGFQGTGPAGFNGRDSHWALDVLNVESASLGASYISPRPSPVSSVPEPESYALLLAGLGLVSYVARRRRDANAGS